MVRNANLWKIIYHYHCNNDILNRDFVTLSRMLSDEIEHNNITPNLYMDDRCSNSFFFKKAYPNEITKSISSF